jgi:3-polyprenyl-4-hydroxybenzoate decarboxylase
MDTTTPIIVGISGASGAIYGVRLLEALKANGLPAHLIISKSAAQTLKEETDRSIEQVRELAETTCQNTDMGAVSPCCPIKDRRTPWASTKATRSFTPST